MVEHRLLAALALPVQQFVVVLEVGQQRAVKLPVILARIFEALCDFIVNHLQPERSCRGPALKSVEEAGSEAIPSPARTSRRVDAWKFHNLRKASDISASRIQTFPETRPAPLTLRPALRNGIRPRPTRALWQCVDFHLLRGINGGYDKDDEVLLSIGVLLFGFEPDSLLLTSAYSARRLESHP